MLDDGHPGDLARRRELFLVLCAIGVDVKKLIRDLYLWQRQDRALLIKERRAHVYEMQAKGIVKLPTSARFSPWPLSARVSVSRHT